MIPTTPASRRYRAARDLTIAQRWLVQIMSEYQFGRIENLRVECGQPVPDRGLTVIRATRLGSTDDGLKIPATDDPELKQAVLDLFDEIERIQNGCILLLAFRHGLPFSLETTAASTLGDV